MIELNGRVQDRGRSAANENSASVWNITRSTVLNCHVTKNRAPRLARVECDYGAFQARIDDDTRSVTLYGDCFAMEVDLLRVKPRRNAHCIAV